MARGRGVGMCSMGDTGVFSVSPWYIRSKNRIFELPLWYTKSMLDNIDTPQAHHLVCIFEWTPDQAIGTADKKR